jgi:hypothetical protein
MFSRWLFITLTHAKQMWPDWTLSHLRSPPLPYLTESASLACRKALYKAHVIIIMYYVLMQYLSWRHFLFETNHSFNIKSFFFFFFFFLYLDIFWLTRIFWTWMCLTARMFCFGLSYSVHDEEHAEKWCWCRVFMYYRDSCTFSPARIHVLSHLLMSAAS